MGRVTRTCLALTVLLLALPAHAEMDPLDYEVAPSDLSEAEAEALRARIADEIAADRARAEAEARTRREAEQAEAARLAARPAGERLVDARCAACHSVDTYQQANLGWLGWHVTVWRMDLINGADVARGEHGVIADWLQAQHPPRGARATLEWVSLMLILLALPLAFLFRKRHHRTK